MRWRVLCENLPDMNLSDGKRQKTAKRPHAFLRAVRDNLWGLSDRVLLERVPTSDEPCTVDVAPGEKPYESPSRTIWNAKDPVIFRLFRNLGFSLTVKIWHRMAKRFLPSDLPSKRLAWGREMPKDGERWILVFQRVTPGTDRGR
jgi:hypothetical protein